MRDRLVIHSMDQLNLLDTTKAFDLKCGFDDRRDRQLMHGEDERHEVDDGGGSIIDQEFINSNGPLIVGEG